MPDWIARSFRKNTRLSNRKNFRSKQTKYTHDYFLSKTNNIIAFKAYFSIITIITYRSILKTDEYHCFSYFLVLQATHDISDFSSSKSLFVFVGPQEPYEAGGIRALAPPPYRGWFGGVSGVFRRLYKIRIPPPPLLERHTFSQTLSLPL